VPCPPRLARPAFALGEAAPPASRCEALRAGGSDGLGKTARLAGEMGT